MGKHIHAGQLNLNLLKRVWAQSELGKLLYESNVLHITSYFYKEVIYYSYILLYQKSNFVTITILLYYFQK